MDLPQIVQGTDKVGGLREKIVGVERCVPLLDNSTRPYINFDNAASTPALRGVQQKVDEFLEWYSSVHRGSGFKSLVSTRAYEQAREIVAGFVGADLGTDCVIFVKNTTEGLNLLAQRFPLAPGDVVLSSLMEHHSNDLPWLSWPNIHIRSNTHSSGGITLSGYWN